jgi:hypothetical protein
MMTWFCANKMLLTFAFSLLLAISSTSFALPSANVLDVAAKNNNHTISAITASQNQIVINPGQGTGRTIFNSLNPYNQYGPTATPLGQGQAAGIQFTGPSDTGLILGQSQIIVRGGSVPAVARIYIAKDSGYNSPGYVIVDTGFCTVPANIQVSISTNYSSVAVQPGMKYWYVLENYVASYGNNGFL